MWFLLRGFPLKIPTQQFRIMAGDLKGKVLTVLGPVEPSAIGQTLTHEHIMIDTSKYITPPEYGSCDIEELDFDLCHLGKIRHFPFAVKKNLVLDSVSDAVSELKLFQQAGGGTICDVTITGIRNKPEALLQISRESGVNIVTGTGYYIDAFLPEDVKLLSTHEMAESMVREIEVGIDGCGVRCGVIGEIGCSYPLMDVEKRALQAAAMAQTKTGAPLIIHPGRDNSSPFEIVSILESAGANIDRTVMSHLDRNLQDEAKLLEFAKLGCIMEYDLFGMECSHYQFNHSVDMLSDAQRIQRVKLLADNGYTDRVVIAHDIHLKHRLVKFGGHGYAHILENIVPKMKERGISPDTIHKIVVDNPRKWLTFI